MIENHTEKKINTFWLDNGGEFTSNEFKELRKCLGIKRDSEGPQATHIEGCHEFEKGFAECVAKNQISS